MNEEGQYDILVRITGVFPTEARCRQAIIDIMNRALVPGMTYTVIGVGRQLEPIICTCRIQGTESTCRIHGFAALEE